MCRFNIEMGGGGCGGGLLIPPRCDSVPGGLSDSFHWLHTKTEIWF